MTFRIISVGWDCADWITQTLSSIELQTVQDYTVHVVDDATEDPRQAETIAAWCDARDERWDYTINSQRTFALKNQIAGVKKMNPNPGDVIVFLDLDGDRLSHRLVLATLAGHYLQVDLTYGNYRPVPNMGTSTFATPFPARVVAEGSYRHHTLNVGCCFNHLRTVRYSVLDQIPDSEYQYVNGEWFKAAPDFAVMIPCLEIANGRYHCIEEVLLDYNHAQPHAEHKAPHETNAVNDVLRHRTNIRTRLP